MGETRRQQTARNFGQSTVCVGIGDERAAMREVAMREVQSQAEQEQAEVVRGQAVARLEQGR